MPAIVKWILEGDPFIQYRARLDLAGQAPDNPQVRAARQAMLADPRIQSMLAELAGWPAQVINSHKSAGHPLHKLVFIADLGLTIEDEPVRPIVEQIMAHTDGRGPFQVLMNIPTHFGGSGTDQWAWALCDSPSILYALLKFGLGDDERVQQAAAHLAGLVRSNGWPCTGDTGKFRGPGRKEDPCPYANLIMLKALAQSPQWANTDPVRIGAETALSLWAARQQQHPYMFYMGTDFEKLKAPLVWYDLLHVLDVLTGLHHLRADPRLEQMLALLRSRADEEGRFTPQSVWQAWKDWEFGQKKAPSRWLTLLAQRVLKRAEL